MPAPKEIVDVFVAHLKARKKLGAENCPVCGVNNWAIEGPCASLQVSTDPPGLNMTGGPPVIMMICSACFFVRQFAWLPMQREAKNG